jgi:WD40 repeat protein
MSTDGRVEPEDYTWVAAIYASGHGGDPLGTGIVLDDRRILTCAHVVRDLGPAKSWVAFPHAAVAYASRREVLNEVPLNAVADGEDLAILRLAQSIPAGVTHAPLRIPEPKALTNRPWWAFGFPEGEGPSGNCADGTIGARLGEGRILLHTSSSYRVRPGFSGGGIWCPDFGAVVAIVCQSNDAEGVTQGDGKAITLHQAVRCFPDNELRILAERTLATDADPLALASWGWRSRAHGASADGERGHRFRGRAAALRAINAWLFRDPVDSRVLVVTGAPGAGKSAVLGRIVITSDADAARELPESDTAVRAAIGSVACAVYARGQTALEVAAKIAAAASAALPDRLEDFTPALRAALTERNGPCFNVIIDALDESPQARTVISKVILPLTNDCADVGAQVVVGIRRADASGDLLAEFGDSAQVVDLDKPEFFVEGDLAEYAHDTLQQAGEERPGSPYADGEVAASIAERIAALSDGNFLRAGLEATTRGLRDETPVDPAELTVSSTVDEAMHELLNAIRDMADSPGGVSAEQMLTALAFAESPGFPASLWRVAMRALGYVEVTEAALRSFAGSSAAGSSAAGSSAAGYVVGSSTADTPTAQFCLSHQGISDALLRARAGVAERRDDERALARAFLAAGQAMGWGHAPEYLLHSLPAHSDRAGSVDDLLADYDYPLYADLIRLRPVADRATTPSGRQRARLLRLSPREVIKADASNRVAMFSTTEALEGLGDAYLRSSVAAPYKTAWAATPSSAEHSILHGHGDAVNAVCAFTLGGTELLATAGDDATVRIWNPATATLRDTIPGPGKRIRSVQAFTHGGATLLALGSDDGSISICDAATGTFQYNLAGYDNWPDAVCTLTLPGITPPGDTLLATAGKDHSVRIWDPATGTTLQTLTGHKGSVNAICAFELHQAPRLATVSRDHTVRIWDPDTGRELQTLTGHEGPVNGVCAFELNGASVLATAGSDRTVRVWDPDTGGPIRVFTAHGSSVNAICAVTLKDATVLATAGSDGVVRVWDPDTGRELHTLTGHMGPVNAICVLTRNDGAPLLVTVGFDRTVRLWDPAAATRPRPRTGDDRVSALCTLTIDGNARLATARKDGSVPIRDLATGTQVHTLTGHEESVNAVCAFTIDGTARLATGGADRTVRVWDPATGARLLTLTGHGGSVNAVCAFTLGGTARLATGGDDRTVRVWDPATGALHRALRGHNGPVSAVCAFALNGTTLLASAGHDRTVRIWNPASGVQLRILPGQDLVRAITALTLDGTVLLAAVGSDTDVCIWNPATGVQSRTLTGHDDWVRAITAFTLDGTPLLATAASDATVRIWNPARSVSPLVVPIRDEGLSVAYADGLLAVGTATGVLAIRLSPEFLSSRSFL